MAYATSLRVGSILWHERPLCLQRESAVSVSLWNYGDVGGRDLRRLGESGEDEGDGLGSVT